MMIRNRVHSSAKESADLMTGMHGYLIRYLYENRDKTIFQRDIEKQFSISRSTVTVTLQLMEKNGLITRESVEKDARLKRIQLTEKAQNLHLQIEADIAKFEAQLTRGITPEEEAVFLKVLEKMRNNLKETKKKEDICKV
jgi:DNA-binding MarR family transcriptional regulator